MGLPTVRQFLPSKEGTLGSLGALLPPPWAIYHERASERRFRAKAQLTISQSTTLRKSFHFHSHAIRRQRKALLCEIIDELKDDFRIENIL